MVLYALPAEVRQRHLQLSRLYPSLGVFALVDGLQYELVLRKPFDSGGNSWALFDGTPEAHLAHAGPHLVEVERGFSDLIGRLAELEQRAPSVNWLLTSQPGPQLAQHLRQQLNVALPEGGTALLRFWDPRVMIGLFNIMAPEQRRQMFEGIEEWHLLDQGNRRWIGR